MVPGALRTQHALCDGVMTIWIAGLTLGMTSCGAPRRPSALDSKRSRNGDSVSGQIIAIVEIDRVDMLREPRGTRRWVARCRLLAVERGACKMDIGEIFRLLLRSPAMQLRSSVPNRFRMAFQGQLRSVYDGAFETLVASRDLGTDGRSGTRQSHRSCVGTRDLASNVRAALSRQRRKQGTRRTRVRYHHL